jgi:hypothetical protein
MEQYVVERDGETWRVKFEGSYVAALPSKEDAIRWAIARAHNAEARFTVARVVLRDEGGSRAVWANAPRWDSAA